MAFTPVNVNYAAEYSKALANAYPYLSYFPEIWAAENSRLYKPGLGKTMYIPTLETSGAKAVNRDQITGTFNRNWNNTYTPVTLEMDREWETLVDPMDMQESGEVATIANITRSFNEQQKVPEMDAYLAAKLRSFVASPDTTSLTASSILGRWDYWLECMHNARANLQHVVCYMRPSVYTMLKNASGVSRYITIRDDAQDPYKGLNINRTYATVDGIPIRVVPDILLKSAYDFTDGWAVASGAKQLHAIMVCTDAIAAPVKYETSMISEPTAQSKGKYLYYERYYYGAFKLDQRVDSIVVASAT